MNVSASDDMARSANTWRMPPVTRACTAARAATLRTEENMVRQQDQAAGTAAQGFRGDSDRRCHGQKLVMMHDTAAIGDGPASGIQVSYACVVLSCGGASSCPSPLGDTAVRLVATPAPTHTARAAHTLHRVLPRTRRVLRQTCHHHGCCDASTNQQH